MVPDLIELWKYGAVRSRICQGTRNQTSTAPDAKI